MKKLQLFFFLNFIVVTLAAQSIRVSGVITDDLGDPLMGATVSIKGTTIGVSSDIDGKYTLDIPAGSKTLSYTFVGMEPQKYPAPKKSTILNIKFKQNNSMLDEVIVTGYGTYKKSAYAGSASVVKTDGMEDVPAVDFSTLLEGNASGVEISSSSGQPGSATSISIRGMGSFNASNQPLIVIDDVPVLSGNLNSDTDAGTDIMSTINTSDIKDITVIKDAAAASLYGSRAANGVILITTKSGREGKPAIHYKSDWGWSDFATNYRRTLSGQERRDLIFDGLVRKAQYGLDSSVGKLTGDDAIKYAEEHIDSYAPIPSTGWADWEGELFRKGLSRNYELSASGGDKKVSYFSSLGYRQQDGITYDSNFERFTGRVNVKYKLTERLELAANILYSKVNQNVSSEGSVYTSPIYSVRSKLSPSDPVYNADGTFNREFLANEDRNPKAAATYNYKKQQVVRSFNTVSLKYKLIEKLIFNTTLSNDNNNTYYKAWNDPRTSDGDATNGLLTNKIQLYNQLLWKSNLTFTRTFDKHNLDVLAGYEINDLKRQSLKGTKTNFPSVDKPEISNGSEIRSLSGSTSRTRLVSYLSRINYSYNDKYFVGVSYRIDGSSLLHRTSRWGNFWSVSGAWRISEEPFMKSFKSIISESKLRASYGTNGTLPSSSYAYLDLVSFGYNYLGEPGTLQSNIGNKNLTWEKNYNFNLGLDIRLFNRVNITAEFFNRQTDDLLMDVPISQTTGFSTWLTNVGKVENKGVEFEVSAIPFSSKKLSWRTAINLSHVSNKVKKLANGQVTIPGSGPYQYTIGKSFYSFYVIEFAGINPDTGVPQYYVNDPDGTPGEITEKSSNAKKIFYKQAEPTLTGGWSNNLSYKNIDFGCTFTFSLGGYSYDEGASKLDNSGSNAYLNIQRYYKNSWKKPGDVTEYEEFIVDNPKKMTSVNSSRRIHSTDHIRLKNVTLGFSLPKKMVRKATLSKVRFFFSAVNLLTFAKYKEYDPEISKKGNVYFQIPKLKTLTFGVDVQF